MMRNSRRKINRQSLQGQTFIRWLLPLWVAAALAAGGCSDDKNNEHGDHEPPDVTEADTLDDTSSPSQDDVSQPTGDPDIVEPDTQQPDTQEPQPQPQPEFASESIRFEANNVVEAGGVCFDFDAPEQVDCEGDVARWDLMFEVDVQSRAFNIWTNGGVKGNGDGAAFGPLSAEEMAQFSAGEQIPGWFSDYFGGVFADSPWYAYDVLGSHDISANGRVYVVDTGTDKYKVQLVSYYGAGGASGQVSVRYVKLGETDTQLVVLDARAGGFGASADDPNNHAAYFDFDAGAVVDINDEEARTNTEWDIAIKRYDVTLNGGASGPGAVRGALADPRDAMYDEHEQPVRAAFVSQTEEEMLAAFDAVTSDDGLVYVTDSGQPYLNGDGGPTSWFGVNPPPPMPPTFYAREENWWVIRSASADSYMKLHVVDVDYASFSFAIEGYVQPRPQQ